VAEFSFEELEQSEVMDVHFMENFDTTSFKLLVPKKGTADNALQALRQKLTLGPGAGVKRKAPEEDRLMMLLLVTPHQRQLRICAPTDSVDRKFSEMAWVAQFVVDPTPDSKVVWLWRFIRECNSRLKPFEFPMQVLVKKSETIAELRSKLQALLQLDKVNLRTWNFRGLTELDDEQLVWDLKLKSDPSDDGLDLSDLAIEAPTQPKKSGTNLFNRGIKFY